MPPAKVFQEKRSERACGSGGFGGTPATQWVEVARRLSSGHALPVEHLPHQDRSTDADDGRRFKLRPGDIVFVAEHPVTAWNRVISQITPTIFIQAANAAGI